MTPQTPHDPARFENSTTLSEALEIAAQDLEHLETQQEPPIHFRMNGWINACFTDENNPAEPASCTVCMAGGVLLRRFKGLKAIKKRR